MVPERAGLGGLVMLSMKEHRWVGEGVGLSGPPGRSEPEGQAAPDTMPRAPAGLLCLGSWVLGAPGSFQQGSGEVGLGPGSPPWQLSWGAGPPTAQGVASAPCCDSVPHGQDSGV